MMSAPSAMRMDTAFCQLNEIDLQGCVYVADSAAMSKDTLDQAAQAKAYLITRGGNNLRIVKKALEQADRQESAWSDPKGFAASNQRAMYRLQEFQDEYEGHPVRLIVVESSALDKKKAHTLEKRVELEYKQLIDAIAEQSKMEFHCETDAEQALKQWEHDHASRFHNFDARIEPVAVTMRRRGRPKKDAAPQTVTRYRISYSS